MTLDQRLQSAVRRVAEEVVPPGVDLDAVRSLARARSSRRQLAVLSVAALTVLAIAVGTSITADRRDSAPISPTRPAPSEWSGAGLREAADACAASTYVPLARTWTDADLRNWLDGLPAGAPPRTAYWHEGVLHVRGEQFEIPDVNRIDEAGETVLLGAGSVSSGPDAYPASWSLIRQGRIEPINGIPLRAFPWLSKDGRIALWQTGPDRNPTVVAWDTETNTQLATRALGDWDLLPSVDAEGMGFLVDRTNGGPVKRWDIRTGALTTTDLRFDPEKGFEEQDPGLRSLWARLDDGFVSPDGTREVFTGPAPGDAPTDRCTTELRVRPVGPIEEEAPENISALGLPDGIPHVRLWTHTDRGTYGVWWETDDTILVDAIIEGQSYLVRCPVDGGDCERVFDLGTSRTTGLIYLPEWKGWVFAGLR